MIQKTLRNALILILLINMVMPIFAKEETSPVASKEGLHIYLLIGGRNMCGLGRYDRKDVGIIPQCYLLNRDDQWEPADAPLNRYSSIITQMDTQKLNLGYTFSKKMLEQNPSISIGLVCNALAKSSIKEWAKGKRYYNEAVRRTKIAQKAGTLKGILWHQGEPDVKDAQYLEKLKIVIADLRKDLDVPDLPFIAGELYHAELFNKQISKLPEQVPFTKVASSKGLAIRSSRAFDRVGVKILGERYAEAMLKTQGQTGVVQTSGDAPQPPVIPTIPTYSGPKENLQFYLLIGQSNMAGRAPYTVEDTKVIDGCWLLNLTEHWEPAQVPLNKHCTIITRLDTNGLNPGYTFAKTMRKHNKSVSIGLISNARGSTSINQWKQGGAYYKEAVRRVKIAQKTGTFMGILWHQGESDPKETHYFEKLKAMVEAYRTEFKNPNLPFVAGEIINSRGKGKFINDQIAELPENVLFTGVAPSESATGDSVHFDNKGQKIMGKRFAEIMIKIQAEMSSSTTDSQ